MGVLSRWAIVGTLLMTGCGAHLLGPVARVKKIGFEGNGGAFSARSDRAVRGAIAHPKPKAFWILWKKKVELDQDALEEDKKRIANWYADRGYFDAQLVRWEIKEVRKAHGAKPPVVKVIGILEEKEPSLVTSLVWEGLDDIALPLANKIEHAAPLGEGRVFTAADYDTALAQTKNILQNQSFAYADAKGRVEVTPSQHAVAITIHVDAGPACTFGEVAFDGGKNVPEKMIRNKVVVKSGEAYKLADIAATERALYGLQVFSVVDAEPDLSTKSTVIPINIKLKPRAPREIRIGGGAEVSSGRQEALASVQFEHNNVFHRIVELDAEAKGGYAIVGADLGDITDGIQQTGVSSGPVVDLLSRLTFPQVPAPAWQVAMEGQFEENVEEAYRYLTPSFRPSITGQIAKHWSLTLGYEYRYLAYLDIQIDLAESQLPLDLEREHYTNTQLMQTLVWDTRNDLIRPSAGGQRSLTLLEASHFLGGDFDYVGALTDLRGYLSLRRIFPHGPPLTVFAARVGGGWLEPYGGSERAYVPYGERLKLGGSNTVRGWVADHLGPYVCSTDSGVVCSSDPDVAQRRYTDADEEAGLIPEGSAVGDNVDTIPVGGLVSAYGSFEFRKYWGAFGAVAFVDIGMVWEDPTQIGQVPLAAAVGSGFRYQTPVGALRFDIAVRTDQIDGTPEDKSRLVMFRNEPPLWFHLALGEAF
jgi:outer membrane protein assembly factor BamA